MLGFLNFVFIMVKGGSTVVAMEKFMEAECFISVTRRLTSVPVFESISSLTLFSNSAAVTNPSSASSSSGSATFISSTMKTRLTLCSAYSGQPIIGTPNHTSVP
ncbi:hypothetical protein ABFX02_06G105000 [Erythranthe guttata]